MKKYFEKNNSLKQLYVCFLGWGMDEKPILPLIQGKNVLLLFDAKDLNFKFDFSPFNEIYLLAFSYGVMEAALMQDKMPKPTYSIALNGTLEMSDPNKGLPVSSRQAMRALTLDNYLDFRRDFLLANETELKKFNENGPCRTIEDSMDELDVLEKMEKEPIPDMTFDRILISESDKIMPTVNQMSAWKDKKYRLIPGNHFALYQFKSLAELFNLSS